MPGQVPIWDLSVGEWFSCSTAETADLFLINHKSDTLVWVLQFPNSKSPLPKRKRTTPWIDTFHPSYPVFKREVFNFSFTMEVKPWQME